MRAILYTRHDGGISVCHPSRDIFDIMQCGGYWDDRPAGFVQAQIDRQIASGIHPDHAAAFAKAVAFGGCTEAEAWRILRDRDCARHGYHHELIDTETLPDRWFRNAWARGHNGGPVFINLDKARQVQWENILSAFQNENANRARDLYGLPPLRIDRAYWKSAITKARDEHELRRVMPKLSSQ